MLGAILYSQAMYELSLEYYEKALAIHEQIGDEAAMADDYNNLASMSYILGNMKKAFEYYEKALAIHEQIGEKNRR
jgi:tetratricopeptide (TPR) repeat protein